MDLTTVNAAPMLGIRVTRSFLRCSPDKGPLLVGSTAIRLDGSFHMDGENVVESLDSAKTDGRMVSSQTSFMPNLTPQQINQALAAIAAKYLSFQFWRSDNRYNSRFRNTYLTLKQRFFYDTALSLHKMQ